MSTEQTLLDMEEDILRMIVKQMDVLSQFQLSETHPYLERVVENEWGLYKYDVTVNEDMVRSCTGPVFRRCFEKLAPFVRQLTVGSMSVTMFRDLFVQTFPNVTILDLTSVELPQSGVLPTDWQNDNQFGDLDMENVVRMFPHLKELKLTSCSISGEHIAKLLSLEQLHLYRCTGLVSEKIDEILLLPNLMHFDIMYKCVNENLYQSLANVSELLYGDVQMPLPLDMVYWSISASNDDQFSWNIYMKFR